ncbi:MAG: diguanylate cyclase, partial [Rectinema subterraneum]|uniref:diguanylate cyclase n=1 Tax=Rectinema subterraneum TaxID=2653714 RepID=UPI003C7B4003
MEIDSSAIRSLFIDSSLSEFFDETDLFYIDFQSSIARSCSTLRYLGYEDADLLDILGAFPVHEADRERALLMQKRIESGETDKVIDSFRVASKKDSRFPWLRFSIKVLGREPDGKPTALIGHVTDVDDLNASQEEIRERLVEIDAMRELIGAINKSLDFEETFTRIIEQLHRIIPFDRATVQAFENDSLTVIAGYGYPKSDIMGLVFPAKGIDNPAVRAIQTQRPIVCNDVSHDFPGFIAASKDFTSLSWLGIPMVYEGQAIGLIALDSHLSNFYTDQHVRVATAMAEHIATAFEHARSHQLVTVQAMTDRLTGLANRYGLEMRGMELFQKAIENDQPIGVFILDIDHFKQVNDMHGHSYGDLVLQQIASTIRMQIR